MRLDELRRRWDRRANENARFHIKSDRIHWTDGEFLASGEADVSSFVDPVLDLLPNRGMALDIGCGLGRLSRALASRFEAVEAVDISQAMITQAQDFAPPLPRNLAFSLCDGDGSLPLKSDTIDFALSYLVFQHLPHSSLVAAYVAEIARVLRPGGIARIQLNGAHRTLIDRISAGIVHSDRVPIVHRKPRLKIDPHSHMGVVFTEARARSLADRAGLAVVAIDDPDSAEMWLTLRSV